MVDILRRDANAPEELGLDELCLPTVSSQVGRDSQWTSLLNAYRRAAGVPDGTGGSTFDDAVSAMMDGSSSSSVQEGDHQSETTSATTVSSVGGGYYTAVLKGQAGTGKSFLVQRLKKCIMDSYEFNFGQEPDPRHYRSSGASYHDDTTISTRSGLFAKKNGRNDQQESQQEFNFAELPTGLFAQGSFTHGSLNSPFSAFTESFNDILDQLICDNLVDVGDLKRVLVDALGSEDVLSRLVSIVPNLVYVLDESIDVGDRQYIQKHSRPSNPSKETTYLSMNSPKGMRYLLRSFLKALTDVVQTYYGGPIVIFLDDSECMDAASANLLASLSAETESQHLLILLAVRPEAVEDPDHLLADIITQTLPQTGRFTEISLENLTLQEVHALVAQAMRRPPPSEDSNVSTTQPLIDFIYQRTHGNCFFVVELLRSLFEKGLLKFESATLRWTWQIEQMKAETSVSENVLDLVSEKLQTLSKEARYVLVMAGCLHSTIELEFLSKIVLGYYPQDGKEERRRNTWLTEHYRELQKAIDCRPGAINVEMDVLLHLDALVACGLMERVLLAPNSSNTGNIFKFTHERIRQAALGLIPKDLPGQVLHVRVGELLRALSESHGQPWMLFASLDHLNKGPNEIVDEHQLELVNMNRQAAEKARELSAFLPATTYYSAAVDLLKQNASLMREQWVLLVQLQTELSICHYRTGNLEESTMVAKAVLLCSLPLQDKLLLYYNLIAVYKAQGNLEEAVNIGMELLGLAGEKFSKKPSTLRIAMEKKKVQQVLGKRGEEQLKELPRCMNELKGAAINVYAVLFGPMFHMGCSAAVDLLCLRATYLTLKYGATNASPLAFAYYASLLVSKEDIDGGYQFGKLSLELLKQNDTEEFTSRTILVANFLSLHWKDPLRETLERLMKGYTVGMMNGDIEMAFTNAGLYQTHYYYCGLPLNTGVKDLSQFIKQMKEYGQHKELSQYKPLWQTMLNLMGQGKVGPTVMTGDAMEQKEFELGKLGVIVMKSYQMQLAYYFGDLVLAQSLMEELRPHSKSFVAPFFQTARRFFFALIQMGLARTVPAAKRAALLKKVNKEDIQWLESRVRSGAVNCLHKLLILKAEMATFESSLDKIEQSFNKAVSAAGQSGFSQDEALANELGAAHFLSSGNFPKASASLTRAYERKYLLALGSLFLLILRFLTTYSMYSVYGAWGARGKVKQLEEKYVLIKQGSTSGGDSSSGNRTSRQQQFSSKLSNLHKGIGSSDVSFSTPGTVKSPEGRWSAGE